VPDIIPDLRRWARAQPASIPAEAIAHLRRHGLYTQRPVADGFFMVRIRIPGGDLAPDQLDAIADLADEHGRGLADITVRQNIQLHWVRPQSLPPIIERLHSIGLSTSELCGDTARNIVNCPVAGVGQDELYDTTGIIRDLTRLLGHNPRYSGLPRKLKIAITGCALHCVYPEINDIGVFAVPGPESGSGPESGYGLRPEPLFRVRVGGGLSDSPRFARDLGVTVRPRNVAQVCGAIASVFRDRPHSPDDPKGLYFTIAESEVAEFRSHVEEKLGWNLERSDDFNPPPPPQSGRSHIGIHRQHTSGLFYVGLSITAGRTSSSHLKTLSGLARKYDSRRLRTTNSQNIVLLDIPEPHLQPLTRDLKLAGFDYEPGWAHKGTLACTGIQFCKLALTETKNRVADLARDLEQQLTLDQPLRISVTGCPNSCGQHRICDVGLEGSSTTVGGVKQEAFQVFLGGGVGATESFSRRLGTRIPADRLAPALTALFEHYQALRNEQESFQDFCRRHTDAALAAFLEDVGAVVPSASPAARTSNPRDGSA
jgi:ferredoxin-nitrite reductase